MVEARGLVIFDEPCWKGANHSRCFKWMLGGLREGGYDYGCVEWNPD